MISSIVGIITSKIGGIVATILAFVGLWLGYKHQKAKRVEAEEKLHVAETVAEVNDEIKEREKKVDAMRSPDDVIDYFGGVRHKDGDSKTTPAK